MGRRKPPPLGMVRQKKKKKPTPPLKQVPIAKKIKRNASSQNTITASKKPKIIIPTKLLEKKLKKIQSISTKRKSPNKSVIELSESNGAKRVRLDEAKPS